jgi:hypothetical protein
MTLKTRLRHHRQAHQPINSTYRYTEQHPKECCFFMCGIGVGKVNLIRLIPQEYPPQPMMFALGITVLRNRRTTIVSIHQGGTNSNVTY